MADIQDLPPTMQAVEPAPRPARSSALWYCVAFTAAPLFLVAFMVWVGSTQWFLDHNDYPMLKQTLGYSLGLRNMDCDIILYGDSTALTGLDPAVVQARTGLKTCNLSELRSVHWLVSSYFPIDQYLLHNKRPKVIFSMWGAFEFHPETQPLAEYQGEGFTYALHFHNVPAFWKPLLAHHLDWIFRYALWAENRICSDAIARLTGHHVPEWTAYQPPRSARAGLWRYPSPQETRCGPPNRSHPLDHDATSAAIAAFKRHYAVDGTIVIVDISPPAACILNRDELTAASAGLGDNRIAFYPITDYNNTDVHFTAQGTRLVSNKAADQILAVLKDTELKSSAPAPVPATPSTASPSTKGPVR